MKLLTITTETQGRRKSDFCWATEGEIAKYGLPCDRDRNNIDGGCGCMRAMVGIDSLKASTTVKLTEVDITLEELTARLANDYIDNWKMDFKEAMKLAHEDAEELVRLGKVFKLGDIVEKRGSTLKTRPAKLPVATIKPCMNPKLVYIDLEGKGGQAYMTTIAEAKRKLKKAGWEVRVEEA